MIGSTVSRYQLLARLAGEEPAAVYQARDLESGELVHLELVPLPPASGEEERRRLAAELKAAAALDDSRACPVREVGEAGDGRLFVARAAGGPAESYASAAEMLAGLRRAPRGGLSSETEPTLVEGPHPTGSSPSSFSPPDPGPAGGVEDLAGRTVAHYQILGRLGSGGMGVVYQAADSRLQRTVALKFLPSRLTRDPAAKDRFLREARSASALDHPNVCTIHEVGETTEGQLYIAMACYDGETLAARIERGPLPVAEAVGLARQAARGLEKAHRKGIVHRDVKPANLMVTGDGIVKILDFGIAKLADAAAQVPGAGFAVGTPAYMSPEQARGAELDARTDLWSLGVVLFEMLTGRTPFRRGTPEEAIRSVLEDPPQPLAELRPETPNDLQRVVARLLAKPLAERYPSATALLADLDALQEPAAVRLRRGAMAAGVLVAALAAYLLLRGGPPSGPVETNFARLTDQDGAETFPSPAPDGGFVYVRADGGDLDLFLERPGGGEPVNLTAGSPQDDTQPAFSPDGRRIAFRSERDGGGIFLMEGLMDAAGRGVRRLVPLGYNPAWSPNGKEIVVATEGVTEPLNRTTSSALIRVDVETGAQRQIKTQDAVQPSWSPNGTRIAYWGLPPGGGQRNVWTVPADGGKAVPVTADGHVNWNPVWSRDGEHLYFASDRSGSMTLWRVPIDEGSGEVRGEPQPLTTPSQWSGHLSLSRDGRTILYATDDGRSNLQQVAFDPAAGAVAGTPAPVTEGSRAVRSADVSPDGQWIAFDTSSPREDLYRVRADGSGLHPLTGDNYKDRIPRWSPDGRRILFYSDRSGRYEAWTIEPEGGKLTQLTRLDEEAFSYPIWSPDGRYLAGSIASKVTAVIDLQEPIGKQQPRPLASAGNGDVFSAFDWSPDGGYLAGILQQDGKAALPGIVLYAFASRSYRRLTERGTSPTWLQNGRTILYLDDGEVWAVDVRSGETREVSAPPARARYQRVTAAPDDRTLYLVTAAEQGDICRLTLPDG